MFKSNTHGLDSLKQKLVKTITFASIGALLALSLMTLKQGQVQGAPSTTLNFQARILNTSGSLVPDGDYHIEFKIYDHATNGGQAQGTCSGNCLWRETRSTGNLVTVKNGFLSVYLGGVTAFPSTIDWNEELWMTMRIGGAGGGASWDSEMTPRIKLTAVPFAFQAEQLAKTESDDDRGTLAFDTLSANRSILLPDASGTVCLQNSAACGFLTGDADDFIQNGTTQQTGANFNIAASSGVAATIQGASGQNIFVLNQNGGGAALTVESDADVVLAGDLAVNGGDITSTTGLNVTASNGAVTVASVGSGNDITLTSADQIILNAGGTIELQDNTNITGTLGVSSTADIAGAAAIGSGASVASTAALTVEHTFTSSCAFNCTAINARTTIQANSNLISGINSGVVLDNAPVISSVALHAASTAVVGTGSAASNYGLYVQNQTVGGVDYGAYIQGADDYGLYIDYNVGTTPATTNVGVYIKNADTYALHVDAGATRLDGTLEVQGAATFGTTSAAGSLAVHDGDGQTVTIDAGAQTGNFTISVPDGLAANDTFCLETLGNCTGADLTFQDVYDNSTPPEFVVTDAKDGLVIKDAASAITGNLLAVQNNDGSVSYLAVTNSGISVTGSGTFSGDIAANGGDVTSTTTLNVTASNGALTLTSTGSGNDIALNSADTIELQDNTNITGNLDVSGKIITGDSALLGTLASIEVSETYTNSDSCGLGCYGQLIRTFGNAMNGPLVGTYIANGVTGGTNNLSYGLYVTNPSTSGGGTITYNTGVRVDAQTTGTNNAGMVIGETTTSSGKAVNLWLGATPDGTWSNLGTGSYSIYNASADSNYFNGNIYIGGDSSSASDITLNTDGSAVFNEQGGAVNFRIEGDTNTNLFNTSGTNNTIGIGTAATTNVVTIGAIDDDQHELAFAGDFETQITAQGSLYLGFDSNNNSGSTEFAIYTDATTEVLGLSNGGNLRARGSVTSGTAVLQGSLVLNDGDGQTATISVGSALAASTLLAIPTGVSASDTFCLESLGNCTGANLTLQGVYDNSTPPEIVVNDTQDGLVVKDASTPITGNLFAVQDNGGTINYLQVTSSGIGVTGNGTISGNLQVDGNTTLGNASGDTLTINSTAVSLPNNLNFDSNTLFINSTTNRVGIGNAAPDAALEVTGDILLSTGAARTIKLENSATSGVTGSALSILGANGNESAGGAVTIEGGDGVSAAGNFGGGTVTVKGGDSTGFFTGGNLVLTGGSGLVGGPVYVNGGAGFGGLGTVHLQDDGLNGTGSRWSLAGDASVIAETAKSSGTAYSLDATNAGANGLLVDVQSNSSSQYILRATSNNGVTNGLYVRADGNVGIGNASPSALLSVGSTSQFQVSSTGAIAAATGVTSSGTITFSGLNCTANANGGAITANASGVLSCTDDNDTTANAFLQGGNDFNATAVLGTTDADDLTFITSNTTRVTINATTGNATFTGDLVVNGGDVSSSTSLNVTASNGALTLTSTGAGNDIVLNSADVIELQDNTNITGNLDVSSTLTAGTGNAFQVSSTGAVTAVGASVAGAIINLNVSSNFNTNINTGNSQGVVSIGNNLGNPTINIDSGTSAINIGTGAQSRSIAIGTGGGTSSQTVTVGSQTSASQLNLHAGTNNINLTASGASNTGVIIQHTSDSTNALQIRDSGSDVLFRADAANNRLYVGNQTASSSADSTLLIVDSASTANLPTGVNGGIVYDSTDGKFKIYEAGAYKTLCNMTDLGCGVGATVDLQDAYDNGGTILTSAANGDIDITLANDTTDPNFIIDIATGSTGEFRVQSNGTDVLQIGAAGQLQLDTQGTGGGILIGTDVQLYRSAANTLSTASGDALTVAGLLTGSAGATISGGTISLNTSGANATNINTGGTGDVTIGNSSSSVDITLDSGGTIAIGTGAQARTVNIATGAAAQALTLGSTNTTSSTLIQGGTGNITLTANGGSNTGTIVNNTNNSTNAFRIQSSGSDVLFRADTSNNRVYVGNSTGTAIGDYTLLVLDNVQDTDYLSSGVNGALVYDAEAHKLKVYENGQWKTVCNTVDAGCGASGASQDLQEAYDNSTTPATIETSSSTKNIVIKSGSGFDSTGVFQIQDSGSDTLFAADTSNNRLYVGNATGTAIGDYTLLVVDRAQDTDYLTSGVNGAIIYDDETDKFKVYEGGAWKTLCNQTDLGCGSAGVSQSLQDAYNNSGTPALITTTSSTKDFILRSGIGFDSTSVFQIQNADQDTLLVADTVNMRLAVGDGVSPANGVLTVGSNTTAASGGIYFGTDTNLYRSAAGTLRTDGNLQLGEGADRTFNVQGRSTNAAGNGLTISAGDAGAGGSAFAGGTLTLQGGSAAGTGDANGGDIILNGGTGVGNGARGLVVISTPTFVTEDEDANCHPGGALASASCTISDSSVSNSSQVIVGFDDSGFTATLPNPINTTAGRIIYITGANGSSDFTLIVNGGGQGNEIAMKANTSATMVWNGNDWTAAGASSSTTLQAAYNNTLTSAGGAEIVLNNTASSNGLTIRNNASNPIAGGIFEVQSSVGTNLFSVNNRGTELAANGGSETEGTWSTNWEEVGSGTASRTTTTGEYVTGTAGAELVTAAADDAIQNNLSGSPVNTIGAKYQVSFTAKSSVNGTPIEVLYSRDGGTTENLCADYVDGNDTSQNLSDTEWTKITCTITINSATAATDPVLIIRKTNGGTPTIWIDNLSFMRNDATTAPSNVQIGGGLDGGPITLFTLDRASAPPVADGDTTYLGSMYYDTITGRIQCYEADGWGACGSAPNNFVNLTPEYAGAVLNGSGVGTMTADFCSNGTLSVNSSICSSGQAQNFYKWTSPQANMQKYSIYVTYQLPAAFKNFDNNNTITLTARIDSTTNADVTYEMYRSEGGSLVQCGTGETDVSSTANAWQTVGINGDEADFASCGFSSASANSNVVFKINVYAKSNASAYVGNLSFTTVGQ